MEHDDVMFQHDDMVVNEVVESAGEKLQLAKGETKNAEEEQFQSG